jgi:hypothetical protein
MKYKEQAMLATCEWIATAHGRNPPVETIPQQGTTVTARFQADLQSGIHEDVVYRVPSEERAP